VLAAAAGVVSYVGPLAGRGVVVIVHGTLRTTYEPVEAQVKRGAEVTAGQRIGTLEAGHVGCPVAACLHWGLLRGETYLDPLSVLKEEQVRLLPPVGGPPSVRHAGPTLTVASRVSSLAPVGGTAVSPGVTWSVAALAGAGVVMIRRRR
jgi:murein DD-endopeptidase MepM/ murein hydrolase activator NlpD